MPVHSSVRLIVVGGVVALGLSGCYADQRGGTLTGVETECAAASAVAEALIVSGGAPDPALVDHLVALGEVASSDVRRAADGLVPLADVGSPSAGVRTEWYAALDGLDQAVLERCDYSIRAIVADVALHADSADSGGALPQPATDDDSGARHPLDWADVQSRIHGADWTDRGYRGIVGLDPGIHVTVYGVETAQLAAQVCSDVLEALATEASTTEVTIEVHGLNEGLLAQAIGGVCDLS